MKSMTSGENISPQQQHTIVYVSTKKIHAGSFERDLSSKIITTIKFLPKLQFTSWHIPKITAIHYPCQLRCPFTNCHIQIQIYSFQPPTPSPHFATVEILRVCGTSTNFLSTSRMIARIV